MRLTRTLATAIVCFATCPAFAQDQDLAQLTKQLDSGTMQEKTKAARMLGEIGPAAASSVPGLIKSLESDNAGLKYEAVNSLGMINSDSKTVVPAIGRVLKDPLPLLRFTAIEALRRFGPEAKPAIPQLKESMKDKEPMLAVSAARALMEIEGGNGADTAAAQTVLIEGLKSDRSDVCAEAVHGLAVIGPPAVPAIQALVNGPGTHTCIQACHALAAIGPGAEKAVEQLMKAAKSNEPGLRWNAITALGDIGPAAKAATPDLIADLSDPDAQVKLSAERALVKIGKGAVPALVASLKDEKLHSLVTPILGEIGPDAKDAVPALQGLLQSKDSGAKREAILALAAIGADARQTAPELIKSLSDKQFPNRPAAAFALGKMGVKEAVPALKEAMAEKDNPILRLASVWALLQIDPSNADYAKSAVPQLTDALENENPEIRREAARTLGRIGAMAKTAVPALQKRLSDPVEPVRRESLIALAEIGSDNPSLVEDFMRVLNEGNPSLRSIACYALGRMGPAAKPALPMLRRFLLSRDLHEKTVAAWALVQIGADAETVQSAIPLLIVAVRRNENPEIRVEAIKALGKVGADSAEVKEALTAAQKDSEPSVRKAAEEALKGLK